MDENQDVKLQEDVKLPEESSTLKETTEDTIQPDQPVATETEDKGDIVETAESNKGYSQRVRELNQAKKEAEQRASQAEEKVQSLAEKLAEVTRPTTPFEPQAQYTPQIEPGAEITPEQYQQDVAKVADARVELKMRQYEAVNRINNEARDALQKYPELNPDSENFNSELSESITEAVEAHVRANPYDASVVKFVDKLMKPYKGAVSKEVGKATENIAKQVSEAALRPTAVRKEEKTPADKTVEELEQELGIVVS